MKYVLKKVLIGVILFLIIGFLKSQNVFAIVENVNWKLGLSTCTYSSGTLFCNESSSVIPIINNNDFTLPKNSIIKYIYVTYGNYVLDNRNDSDIYYVLDYNIGNTIIPRGNNCIENNYQYNFKNVRPISCKYRDYNGDTQDCLSWFVFKQPYNNILHNSSYGYISETPYWDDDIENQVYSFFKVPGGSYITDLTIKYGGFGNYNGSLDNLFSGRNNSSWSNYYVDYPLVNNCSYSRTQDLTIGYTRNWQGVPFSFAPIPDFNYVDYPDYGSINYGNYNITELESDISYTEGVSELEKDFAIQDRLIGYSEDDASYEQADMITNVVGSLSAPLDSPVSLFTDLLATPVNLLYENAEHELVESGTGGALTCGSYVSQYLDSPYNNVKADVTLTLPFVHNQFTLSCFNVDILSKYHPIFGSYHNQSVHGNLSYLDRTLAPIYHILLTGLLSYKLILAYFKLIKETYDPDNNTIEVIDL